MVGEGKREERALGASKVCAALRRSSNQRLTEEGRENEQKIIKEQRQPRRTSDRRQNK